MESIPHDATAALFSVPSSTPSPTHAERSSFRCQISREHLLPALTLVQAIAEPRTSLPILSHVCLEARSNSHFAKVHAITALLAAFSWERRRLSCSGSGQDGRAPRGASIAHDLRFRLYAHQMAKMRIAGRHVLPTHWNCAPRTWRSVSVVSVLPS